EDRADLGDLRMFEIAQKYQDQYDLRFDTNQMTDQLVKRRMLCRNNDGFAFQYKFVYLYFVAQYLARNMGRLDVRSHVDGLCARLELEHHADIMLFLAHLTSDDYIVRSLISRVERVYPETPPITLEEKFSIANPRELTDAVYHEGIGPLQQRMLIADTQDEIDREPARHAIAVAEVSSAP